MTHLSTWRGDGGGDAGTPPDGRPEPPRANDEPELADANQALRLDPPRRDPADGAVPGAAVANGDAAAAASGVVGGHVVLAGDVAESAIAGDADPVPAAEPSTAAAAVPTAGQHPPELLTAEPAQPVAWAARTRQRWLVLLYQARRRAVQAPRWLTDRWRRSLQLRVAATTLLVSGAVVLVVGVLLVSMITSGVLDAKSKAAHAETKNGLRIAERQLSVVTDNKPEDLQRTLKAVTTDLASRGTNAGLFSIVMESDGDPPFTSGEVSATSVPGELRALVGPDRLVEVYAPIRFNNGTSGKGLIVGAPIAGPAGSFQLFYIFPLQDEERTIALIRRTVLLTGILLVLLVAAIAALVTRQVVRPVRVAAQTAERLAAGRLEERMQVRGKDDLALLASAFNDMANSLQRQIRKLEEMSRLQRRFTSDVSHELRTPLTTVRMAADVLHASRGGFSPEVSRSAELLQAELDRFEELLADLLEISRYDAQVAVLEAEPTDLRTLVRAAIEATAPIASRQGTPILPDLPDRPVVAEVDARRVERILRNLLVNAVEHGERRPIDVRMRGDADAVAITVRDHGVGLRSGEAALVFDRFWRADPSRDRRTGGTGLGLSISLEDARLHGGWLHAWGRPGQGAQFRLTLPVRGGDVVVSSPLPIEPENARRAGALLRSIPGRAEGGGPA